MKLMLSNLFVKPICLFLLFFIQLNTATSVQILGDSIDIQVSKLNKDEKIAFLNRNCKAFFQSNPERSIAFARKIIQLSDTSLSDVALGYKNLGIVSYYQAEYSTALCYYDTAIVKYKEAKDYVGIAAILNNKGLVFMEQGMYDEALGVQFEAYGLNCKYAKEIEFCINLINIANIYSAQNFHSKSIEYNRKALMYLEKSENSKILADALNNMGTSASAMGFLDDAKNYYLRSLSIRKALNDKLGIATSNANLGNVYLRINMFREAILMYEKSIAMFDQLNNPRGLVSTLNFCSEAYLYLKDIPNSERLSVRALQIANQYNLREVKTSILRTYKECLLLKGDNKLAYSIDESCRLLEDSLNNENLKAHMASLEATYQAAEKERQLQKVTIENEREIKKWSWIVAGLLILILLTSLLSMLYHFRQKHRNAVLAGQKINIENQLLRSQMNPHFIFNSLSSIQSFIMQDRTVEADIYLSKFARLMRLVLQHSEENFVLLENEIESLKLYLDLERNRFNNRFEYQFKIGDSIEPEMMKVPPMLMQPFVENALIHGISHLEVPGMLIIELQFHDDILKAILTDNGVGRERSNELKLVSDGSHKSMGLTIARQRLRMFNKQTTSQYQVNFIDLHHLDGSASGTQVEISMPWISA